jgi:hypothetical protein
MRIAAIAGLGALVCATAAWAQPEYMMNGNLCLKSYQIDDTRTPDDRTIVFHMKDGKRFMTELKQNCPELAINGFTYLPTPPDEVCGNLQIIKSNNGGSVCMMGPIVPYVKPHSQM